MNHNQEDQDLLATEACPIATRSELQRSKKDESYKEHLYLVSNLSKPIAENFNVSQNMTYYDLNMYADAIFAR
jgi:hypothetical protein